jgi:hypothetical protein
MISGDGMISGAANRRDTVFTPRGKLACHQPEQSEVAMSHVLGGRASLGGGSFWAIGSVWEADSMIEGGRNTCWSKVWMIREDFAVQLTNSVLSYQNMQP